MSYRVRELERVKFVLNIWEADTSASMPPSTVANNGDKCITLDDGALYIRDGRQWVKVTSAASAAAWGAITGTLASQTDLQSALNAKAASVHSHVESDVAGLVNDIATLVAADATKQPLDSDLTTIAGLAATSNNFMVAAASAWASLTPTQAKTALSLVKADVGLGNVDNTADASKPVSTAQQTALDLKANLAGPTFTGTVTLPAQTVTLAMQANMATGSLVYRKSASAGVPEINTLATLKTDLVLVKADVGLGSVDNTADTAKPVSTAQQTALDLKAPLANPTFTGTVTVPGLTLNNATDITINSVTGSKIGQATSKIGFFGIAPVVRPTTLTQTYATASATHAAITSLAAPAGGVGVAAGGWSTAANRDLAITSINAIRTDLANLKDFVNQVVDQLQALGILQ